MIEFLIVMLLAACCWYMEWDDRRHGRTRWD
jgi:hypothetical protein